MVGFSVQDVAFGGFADVRAHPRALWVWTPLAFVASVGLQVATLGMPASRLGQFSVEQDPARAAALVQQVLPGELAMVAVALAVTAVVQTTMIRLVLRPAEARFGYVRIGPDELRQLALSLLSFCLIAAVAAVLSLVFGIIAGLTGAPIWVVMALDLAATACVVILISVRLSLAPALTFDRGRVDLFGSWGLTRDRFWLLLGTYVMVLALSAVIYVVAAVLIVGLGGLVLGPDIVALSQSPTTLAAMFSPMRLILAVFGSFLSALVWPVVFTPSARLYASLAPAADIGPSVWA
jgi:hypothetical protein